MVEVECIEQVVECRAVGRHVGIALGSLGLGTNCNQAVQRNGQMNEFPQVAKVLTVISLGGAGARRNVDFTGLIEGNLQTHADSSRNSVGW